MLTHSFSANEPPGLSADPVVEPEMATEIPRDAEHLNHNNECQCRQGGDRSDHTRPDADSRHADEQQQRDEPELRSHQMAFGQFDRFVVVGEMAVRITGQGEIPGRLDTEPQRGNGAHDATDCWDHPHQCQRT